MKNLSDLSQTKIRKDMEGSDEYINEPIGIGIAPTVCLSFDPCNPSNDCW